MDDHRLLDRRARRNLRLLAFAFWSLLCLAARSSSPAADDHPTRPSQDASRNVDFASEVAPILQKSCIDCHGPDLQLAGLRLDRRQSAMRGGHSGRAIEPGSSADSLMV